MNKWIAILVIAVLAIGVIVGGYFLWQQTNKLGEAESEIVALEGNVATLEGNVSTLETSLAESEATVSTLEADLKTANDDIEDLQADVSTQRAINSALSEELKKVKDPRHFESLTELTDWLYEDDTDTKYADVEHLERAFILQVRALRDGYLLPVSTYIEGDSLLVINRACIGDSVYAVWSSSDYTAWYEWITPLPSHPLPLD